MSRTPSPHRLDAWENPLAAREADRYVYDDPVGHGRLVFLDALARHQPAILEDLRKIARTQDWDSEETDSWAAKWHLTDDWCLAHARATIRLYRVCHTSPATLCWADVDIPDDLLSTEKPRPATKKPEHFDLLAQYHLCPTFSGLARLSDHKRQATERAIKRTAAMIGLTLREAPKGNPAIGKIGAAHSKAARRKRDSRRLLSNLGR